MRVLKFAWHLFWAARRWPYETLASILYNTLWDRFTATDTELTEALRRYGR